MSIVVGTEACNARCPYCISKMTPSAGVLGGQGFVWGPGGRPNVRNLQKSLLFAQRSGVSTLLLTGKGEPTLFPSDISFYLQEIGDSFPFIEMQTNGFLFEETKLDSFLEGWYQAGLTTISLSIVSPDPDTNSQIMKGSDPGCGRTNTEGVIRKLHDLRFSVRINCTMLRDAVDSWEKVVGLVAWCKKHKVEQLTIREVAAPEKTENKEVSKWVEVHCVPSMRMDRIRKELEEQAVPLLHLPHGAVVYDLNGQNICLNNCLTRPEGEDIRQIIFFPDGHLRYDWVYGGAVIL